MEDVEVLGREIRAIRNARLMTMVELAAAADVSYAYLKAIETDGRQPSGRIVHKIAWALTPPNSKTNTRVLAQITRPLKPARPRRRTPVGPR